jgi:hypothetical protein
MDQLAKILGQDIPDHKGIIRPAAPRILTPDSEGAVKTVEEIVAENMSVYFENPWAMIEDECIWTLDQTDMLTPVKPFPNRPWLEAMTMQWLNEPLFACFKSRRMTITWLMVFLHLWLAMFREGAAIFFVSDKEEKSDELIQRAKYIYDHIPNDKMLKPKAKYSYCYLDFPGLNTYIQGVPQGADQLRQFTATAILADEFAFWDKAKETFMASKPTIDGGGRFTTISSPREGFFKELCFDLVR